MGMWRLFIGLRWQLAIGGNIEFFGKDKFIIEIYFVCLIIRIGFSDFASGLCIFGHQIDTRELFKWRGKKKLAMSTSS